MSIVKKFLKYTIPSVVSMWVFCIYTMVDGMFVANGVGEMALAAVNISIPFTNLLFGLSLWVTVGTSTMVSVAMGRGDRGEANRIFSVNFYVLAIFSVIITLLAVFNLESLSYFLGATGETIGYVKSYLGIIALFSSFYMLSYCMEVLVKADGFPVLSTLSMCFGAVVNIGLDYVFVMRMGWGVEGAAWATGIAQIISTVIFFIHFSGTKSNLKFIKCKFDLSIYKTILPLGLSDSITEVSTGATVFMYNIVLIKLIGNHAVVSYTIISYIYNIILMTMSGISQGIQPIISYSVGEGNKGNINKLYRMGIFSSIICGVAAFGLCFFFGKYLVMIFISGENMEFVNYSVRALKIFASAFLVMGFNVVTLGFFTAVEKPKYSFIISVSRGLILIPVGMVISILIGGKDFIWFGIAVSECICLIPTAILRKKYGGNTLQD